MKHADRPQKLDRPDPAPYQDRYTGRTVDSTDRV
jgi:hypothetical protein